MIINLEAWNPYTFINAKEVMSIAAILLLIILAACMFFVPRRYKRSIIGRVMLVFWIFTIISATTFGREASDVGKLNLNLFWTFQRAWTKHSGLHWYYIIGNILLFAPLGFLLPLAWKKLERWWLVALMGAALSLAIEILQYSTGTGLCELDDLFHNTFGSFTGYQVFIVFQHIVCRGSCQLTCLDVKRLRKLWILSFLFITGLILCFAILLCWNRPDWTGVFY